MSTFSNLNYKVLLKDKIIELKRKNSLRFTFEALARACRVQKTYLSKVLNHEGNLNTDQLYRACEFLRFSQEEIDYIFLVYEYANTQIDSRKKKLHEQILVYKKKSEKTESHLPLQTQSTQTADLVTYYSDPNLILIHMFCSIRRFAEKPELIGEFLGLTKERINLRIKELTQLGFLEKAGSGVQVLKDNTHLSKLDVMYKVYRSQMRLKALEKMNKEESPQYSFSVVFSTDPMIRDRIQEGFMNFLKETQKLVQSGNEEEVYQMNFDLLGWSEKELS